MGETFTVGVNHLKSKGSSCASIDDPDGVDGEGNCNGTRVWQAETVMSFVDSLISDTGDADVLVVGDMNSYLEEDPIVTFESEYVNLVSKYDKDPYSYNFFASFAFPWVGRGLLDHAFGTPSMARQVTKAVVWHINADEVHAPDWDDPGYMPRYFTADEFRASAREAPESALIREAPPARTTASVDVDFGVLRPPGDGRFGAVRSGNAICRRAAWHRDAEISVVEW